MTYVSVSSQDLIVIALAVLIAVRAFPPLRLIGILLFVAAAVTPFTSPLEAPVKGLIYLPFDVMCGFVGVAIWARTGEKAGLGFLAFSIACLLAHLVMFASPPHTTAQHWWYVATLNVLFISFCLYLGGTGFARLHRHLWERRGDPRAGLALGSGG